MQPQKTKKEINDIKTEITTGLIEVAGIRDPTKPGTIVSKEKVSLFLDQFTCKLREAYEFKNYSDDQLFHARMKLVGLKVEDYDDNNYILKSVDDYNKGISDVLPDLPIFNKNKTK